MLRGRVYQSEKIHNMPSKNKATTTKWEKNKTQNFIDNLNPYIMIELTNDLNELMQDKTPLNINHLELIVSKFSIY